MPLVLFDVAYDKPNPSRVEPDARAVPADVYAHLDDDAGNPGGITKADIPDGDIRSLGSFEHGSEVYVEADDPNDVLDDDDPDATRIWWRGTIITGIAPGGSA